MGLSIGVSLAAYAWAVGGVYGLSLLCPECGLLLLGWCAYTPACGVWFVFCFWYALYAGLVYLVWLPVYRAGAPPPKFLGEVLSVFRFLWEP